MDITVTAGDKSFVVQVPETPGKNRTVLRLPSLVTSASLLERTPREVFALILDQLPLYYLGSLGLSCKALYRFAFGNETWSRVSPPWLILSVLTDQSSLAKAEPFYLSKMYARKMNVVLQVKKAWNSVLKFFSIDLTPGLSEDVISELSSRLPFPLPPHIEASFTLYNGQTLYTYSSISKKKLFGDWELLCLQEIVDSSPIEDSGEYGEGGGGGRKYLPLTSGSGNKNYYFDSEGKIFLKSGWNLFYKFQNFEEFLLSFAH